MKCLFYILLISFISWGYANTSITNETSPHHYTVITDNVNQITQLTDQKVEQFYQTKTTDKFRAVINFFEQQNIPYLSEGAMGEGGCDGKTPCLHIQQDPLYRLDGLNCTTLTQFFLSLLKSSNLKEFQTNWIKISYGAAKNSASLSHTPVISYLNRNHFTSSDFNRVNQKNHLLSDVTNQGYFKNHTAVIQGTINHAQWFAYQSKPETIANTIRLRPENIPYAESIVKLFQNNYGKKFPLEKINLSYIPKEFLVKQKDLVYTSNENIIDKIPTPSIVEFVRDDKYWLINDVPINKIIGSDILVSHMGILYRQRFNHGEVIYQNIACDEDKRCQVTPVYCQNDHCQRTMMLVASNMYPEGYIYSYNRDKHAYACTAAEKIPKGYAPLKTMTHESLTCNRVLSMPLGDYLTMVQYGHYVNMQRPSLIGIHLESIHY